MPSTFNFDLLDPSKYHQWYQTGPGKFTGVLEVDFLQRILQPVLQSNTSLKALEIGCGTGFFTKHLLEWGFKVTAVDVSKCMVEYISATLPETTVVLADAEELPFEKGSFDVILCLTALEFIKHPTHAINEMLRCLSPSGRLILGTLNPNASINKKRFLKKGRISPLSEAKAYQKPALKALFNHLHLSHRQLTIRTGVLPISLFKDALTWNRRFNRWLQWLRVPFGIMYFTTIILK